MAGRSNSCFSLVALVCLALECWTEAAARVLQGEQVHGTDVQQVQVVASVLCDVCLEGRVTKNSVFLSDVTTIMECKNRTSQTSYYNIQGNTDKTGRFIVELPSSNLGEDWQEDCSISVQGPPADSSCSIPLSSGLSSLRPSKRLNSEKKKIVYTAGPFIYQPTEAVNSCAQHRYQLRPITSSLQILASTDSLSLGPPDPPRP